MGQPQSRALFVGGGRQAGLAHRQQSAWMHLRSFNPGCLALTFFGAEGGGVQQLSTGLSRREKDGLDGEDGGIEEVAVNRNKGSSNRDKTTSIMEIVGNVEDNGLRRSPEDGDSSLALGPVRVTSGGRCDTGGHTSTLN